MVQGGGLLNLAKLECCECVRHVLTGGCGRRTGERHLKIDGLRNALHRGLSVVGLGDLLVFLLLLTGLLGWDARRIGLFLSLVRSSHPAKRKSCSGFSKESPTLKSAISSPSVPSQSKITFRKFYVNSMSKTALKLLAKDCP